MNIEREYINFEKIYNDIRPELIKLHKNYQSLNLSESKFILVCEDLLIEIYHENNKIKNIAGYLELLKKYLNEYMIIKYIQDNIKISEKEENILTLNKLDEFLNSNNIEQTPELYEQLLKNNTIDKIITNIIKKNIDLIKEEGLEKITHNSNLTLLLEMYCENNGIPFKNKMDDMLNDIECQSLNSLGLYMNQISKTLLTKEEEQRLFELKEQGDETAAVKIAEHNLLLVVSIAKSFTGKGLDILDLIQEGNIGLMNAIEKFDYHKGYKLSTYATWWIRQSIQRSIMNNAKIIRIPVHVCEKISKYSETIKALEKELERTPTSLEICDKMNITREQFKELERATQGMLSLNALIGDEYDSETELGDLIASDDEPIAEEYFKSTLFDEINHILEKINLSEKEKFVLFERFGFEDNTPKTLEEIAKKMGITRERVRQIEAKALRKIRMSPYIKRLASLSDIPLEDNVYTKIHMRTKH